MIEYKIIKGTAWEVENAVKEFLGNGWKLYGFPIYSGTKRGTNYHWDNEKGINIPVEFEGEIIQTMTRGKE
jgi:hypothetical protein